MTVLSGQDGTARGVFTCFHYERDSWRVTVVRDQYLAKGGYALSGAWDHALWEATKRQGGQAVKRLITAGLEGTTVTAVLIGARTAYRPWVLHQISQSYNRGNGLLGIYVHNIENQMGLRDSKGPNPFDQGWIKTWYGRRYMSEIYPTYDWVNDDGAANVSEWIEQAAEKAGR
jgi:hypothetical protein